MFGDLPLERDCAVRFKPQICDVRPLRVRGWRATAINLARSMIWMYRPLIVTQKVAADIRFLRTETLFAPFSPTSAESGDSETARDSRDNQSGKSRVKKAAYAAVFTELRGGPSLAKLVDKPSEIDGVFAVNAGDAGSCAD